MCKSHLESLGSGESMHSFPKAPETPTSQSDAEGALHSDKEHPQIWWCSRPSHGDAHGMLDRQLPRSMWSVDRVSRLTQEVVIVLLSVRICAGSFGAAVHQQGIAHWYVEVESPRAGWEGLGTLAMAHRVTDPRGVPERFALRRNVIIDVLMPLSLYSLRTGSLNRRNEGPDIALHAGHRPYETTWNRFADSK